MNDYDLKKAGEKLIWRLKPDAKGNYKMFKPNRDDFKALKTILLQLNAGMEKQRLNNHLFTKLFIRTYRQIMLDYDTDVLDLSVKKMLFKELRLPLANYYKRLDEDIKFNQIDKMLERWKSNGNKDVTNKEFLKCFDNESQIKVINSMVNEALNLQDITPDEVQGTTPFVQDDIYSELTDIGFEYLTSSKATESDILKAIKERSMTAKQRAVLLTIRRK